MIYFNMWAAEILPLQVVRVVVLYRFLIRYFYWKYSVPMSKALMKQSKGKSKFSILLYTGGFLYPQLFLSHTRHLKMLKLCNFSFVKVLDYFSYLTVRWMNSKTLLSENNDVKRQVVISKVGMCQLGIRINNLLI